MAIVAGFSAAAALYSPELNGIKDSSKTSVSKKLTVLNPFERGFILFSFHITLWKGRR
jgi:hypothetical protein